MELDKNAFECDSVPASLFLAPVFSTWHPGKNLIHPAGQCHSAPNVDMPGKI